MTAPEDTPTASEVDTDPDTVADTGEPRADLAGGTWLPLRDASEELDVSVSALRKWHRAGELESRMAPGPTGDRVEVELESARTRAAQTIPHVAAEQAAAPSPAAPAQEATAAPAPGTAMVPLSELSDLFQRIANAEARAARAEAVLEHTEEQLTAAREAAQEPDDEPEGGMPPWLVPAALVAALVLATVALVVALGGLA